MRVEVVVCVGRKVGMSITVGVKVLTMMGERRWCQYQRTVTEFRVSGRDSHASVTCESRCLRVLRVRILERLSCQLLLVNLTRGRQPLKPFQASTMAAPEDMTGLRVWLGYDEDPASIRSDEECQTLIEQAISGLPTLSKAEVPVDDNCGICLQNFGAIVDGEVQNEGSLELEGGETVALSGVTKLAGCGHIFCRLE